PPAVRRRCERSERAKERARGGTMGSPASSGAHPAVAGLLVEAELVGAPEERVLQPAARLRAGDRVVEEADGDADEQEERSAGMLLPGLLLDARRGLPELSDGQPDVVLDVLVA